MPDIKIYVVLFAAPQYREVFLKNPLLIILLVLLFMVLLFIFYKQKGTAKTKKTTKAAKASSKKNHHPNQESIEGGSPDWVDQVNHPFPIRINKIGNGEAVVLPVQLRLCLHKKSTR